MSVHCCLLFHSFFHLTSCLFESSVEIYFLYFFKAAKFVSNPDSLDAISSHYCFTTKGNEAYVEMLLFEGFHHLKAFVLWYSTIGFLPLLQCFFGLHGLPLSLMFLIRLTHQLCCSM